VARGDRKGLSVEFLAVYLEESGSLGLVATAALESYLHDLHV
jgi:hypothetical protein